MHDKPMQESQLSRVLNVLIVEDSQSDGELMVAELQEAGFEPRAKRVDTEADYLANLNPQIDVILSDYSLPEFSALLALQLLQESKFDIPFIIVSGSIGEEHAVECMKVGATDYVLKDRLERLGPILHRALREYREHAERKRLEKQFIEAQKMEVVGHLASGVAHDFNNILGVIIGYSDLMMPELAAGGLTRQCAEEIRQAAERAAALTRQLLLFSRKQVVQAVTLDINEVVTSMDKILRRLVDENIEFNFNLGREIACIKADSGQIGQVLMNLVVNARDAMPNGGTLTIKTQNVTLGADEIKSVAAGDYVMLSVTDSGMGMSNEVKERLFEAFFTTKPEGKGTGLGLATCQTIVKQCGGYISVESEVGKGATFNIFFPQTGERAVVVAQPTQAETMPRGTETLLLVEDEPAVRHMACNILQTLGYNVLRANNGQEGLQAARLANGHPIRLVISDVMMPQMNGRVMAEWLKATYPEIKILFTSGYTDEPIGYHDVKEGTVAFLPKPYTPVTLAHNVRKLLDS